ncbi:AbrB/MazE/SpoVT family DNA-binding domain-containing protein [Candidatus Woesearchaeota archaeon]|nr:AbrB/MazE/SpoVT family DNA-binding domain-containing protein [Candidatus Woesearchaeota archaeon]
MAIDVKVRKWGNSMGIVLPKEFVKENNIKEGEEIGIAVFRSLDLRKIPKLKFKESTQKIKDELRKGWD